MHIHRGYVIDTPTYIPRVQHNIPYQHECRQTKHSQHQKGCCVLLYINLQGIWRSNVQTHTHTQNETFPLERKAQIFTLRHRPERMKERKGQKHTLFNGSQELWDTPLCHCCCF